MNIKKQAVEQIIDHLLIELRRTDMELNRNRYEINKLAEQQSIQKEKKTEIYRVIGLLKGKGNIK